MFENSIKDLAYAQEIADLEEELEQVKKENEQLTKLFHETNRRRRKQKQINKDLVEEIETLKKGIRDIAYKSDYCRHGNYCGDIKDMCRQFVAVS